MDFGAGSVHRKAWSEAEIPAVVREHAAAPAVGLVWHRFSRRRGRNRQSEEWLTPSFPRILAPATEHKKHYRTLEAVLKDHQSVLTRVTVLHKICRRFS
jgi:hypothetical protein